VKVKFPKKHISVSFPNYNDKEEILRRSKLIRGIEGSSGHGVAALGSQLEPQLHITEESSRKVRASRQELLKFCREIHKRFPDKKCDIKYDRLFVDNDVYVWNEKIGRIERIGSGSGSGSGTVAGIEFKKSSSKYSKTFLEVDEDDVQSRF
jgi:hypothetical protein